MLLTLVHPLLLSKLSSVVKNSEFSVEIISWHQSLVWRSSCGTCAVGHPKILFTKKFSPNIKHANNMQNASTDLVKIDRIAIDRVAIE